MNNIKTIHVTPASASLEILLKSRLKMLQMYGFDVVGFSSDKGLELNEGYGVKFRNSGFRYVESKYLTRRFSVSLDLRFFIESYKLFKNEKPAIVNTYGPKPGLLARIAARLARVPIVVHTSWGLYFTQDSPWYKKLPIIFLDKFASLFCDYIFSVNKDDLDLMKRYRFKDPHHVAFMGNGTDVEMKFNPENYSSASVQRLKSEMGLDLDSTIVGMVGRLTESKGYREFIQAAFRIRMKHDNVQFAIVGSFDCSKGDGISKVEIQRLEELRVIKYLGSKKPEEMPGIYSTFDAVVLPSYREGLPRTMVEASSMGKPLITTDTRGCRETVENARNGFLVPVGDSHGLTNAIERLVSDKRLRETMGKESRQKALREFNESILVERVINVYNFLLEEKGINKA